MLSKIPSSLRSKKGFVGALVLFYGTMHGVFGLVQDATYAASNWGEIVGFLTSGLGNLFVVAVGILLILWAVLTQQPEIERANAAAPTIDIAAERETERLKREVRAVAQERDRYRDLYTEAHRRVQELTAK